MCKKCNKPFAYVESNTYWIEENYGYSVKLVNCTDCDVPTVLIYEEDSWIREYEETK